jgi:hypothetical protein
MIKKYPVLKKISSIIFFLFSLTPFKTSVKKVQLLTLLVFLVFSFKGNAQCTITGITVNSSTFNPDPCATATLSGCSIVYIGDGVNTTTLVMNQNLNLSCLGPIQLVVRNLATISFESSSRLTLAVGSNLIIETGGNLSEVGSCNNSQRIYIGNDLIASCLGSGGVDYDFGEIVDNGGYSSLNVEASPSFICDTGSSILTATAIPSSGATYNWYDVASGGSPIQNGGNTFNTGVITSSKTYYVQADYSAYKTVRKAVTVTVNSLPTTPTVGTITQPTCSFATGSVVLGNLPASGTINQTGTTTNSYTITGTTMTITGLFTGFYNFTVTNASGCTSSTSANVVINAQPSINTWQGSLSSSDWNNPSNWSCGTVPTISTNVLIPSAPASGNFPTIAAGGPGGLANNIEIQEDASVTIAGVITDILKGTGTGNVLTIAGNLTLNGIIDLNGESQLVQGDLSGLSGMGTIEIDQQGTGNSFWYNYWSSPVNSKGTAYTIEDVLRDANGGTLINKNIDFDSNFDYAFADGPATPKIKLSTFWMRVLRDNKGYSSWDPVRHTGDIAIGEGFSMKGSNTGAPLQNYTFVGQPNNGNINLPLTGSNHYLVGNPYPSAIDVDKFLEDNTPTADKPGSITGAVYFWEHYGGSTHYLSDYIGGYASRNRLGEAAAASAFPDASGIRKIPGPYIPVGQGFFVVGNGDGGHIKFKNSQRVFGKESLGDAVFLKTSNTKSKTANVVGEDLRPKFRIGFDAPKISHRQLLFGIDERATPGVDWGFDAKIYQIFADDMYWMLNGNKYVIQATNETGLNSEVPLGIQLSKTGVATVKIDALENVDDDTSIYLKDKLTGETFNMREKPIQLNLTAGKYEDRFVIVFKTQKLVAEDVKAEVLIPAIAQPVTEGIQVFMNKALGELQIKNNSSDEIVGVALRNALGQTVKMWNSNFKAKTISLPISITTGIYLVQINTKTGKTVKKISVE